jgi:Transposase IS4
LIFFIILLKESARGRLSKRPRVDPPLCSSSDADFAAQNIDFPRKRIRKTPELPQFSIYQDQILDSDRKNPSGQNEPTPSLIGRQINKVWPHISVDIPFRAEFHSISTESTSTQNTRLPLASLSSIAINGAKRAPKIPQEWLKNQSNDHTSEFFGLFSLISLYFINILIAPSIPDDSTADQKLNKALFPIEEAAESFKDCSFNDLLRPLPHFTPIPIAIHSGRPQNLLNDKHWHPLRLFKLFFNWETMSIIVKETNSYAFRTNSAKNPWKTLEIHELYHFFGCLIRLALFKHPPRASY